MRILKHGTLTESFNRDYPNKDRSVSLLVGAENIIETIITTYERMISTQDPAKKFQLGMVISNDFKALFKDIELLKTSPLHTKVQDIIAHNKENQALRQSDEDNTTDDDFDIDDDEDIGIENDINDDEGPDISSFKRKGDPRLN